MAHAAALLLAAFATACRPATAPSPSVVLIVMDTTRADHVGALDRRGDAPSPTPAIDAWARDAAVFPNAFTPAPFTMPSVASMMTGAWPDRTGVVVHDPDTTLASWTGETLAEAATRAGLATGAVVANPWLVRESTGFDRGFASFSRMRRSTLPEGTGLAAATTDEAIRLLDSFGDRRFLLWVHYFDPHMPYEPPPSFARAAGAPEGPSRVMAEFDAPDRNLRRLYSAEGFTPAEVEQARKLYEGEVRYTDAEVGRLLARVAAAPPGRETIVALVSDHGESLGEHGLYFAHDYTLYDELARAVTIVKAPGHAPGLREAEVSLVDLAPTLCRAAALECRGGFDGRDLFAGDDAGRSAGDDAGRARGRTLFGAATPRRARGAAFARLEVHGMKGRWTMAVRDGLKLLRIPTAGGIAWEAYDLRADPGETVDIVESLPPQRRATLQKELEQWMDAMEAVRPASRGGASPQQKVRDEETLRSLGYLQ